MVYMDNDFELWGGATESVPRRKMHVIMVVDNSGSMYGEMIGAVNDAGEDLVPLLRDINNNNTESEIQLNVLSFNSTTHWMYDHAISIDNFIWQPLQACGMTSFGAACEELCSKLSRHGEGFMSESKITSDGEGTNSGSGYFAPAIILMSDGHPTDTYKIGLEKLKKNNWFKYGIKLAIDIPGANVDTLAEFTGTKEAIFSIKDEQGLKDIIKATVVTSSLIGSTSTSVSDTEEMTEEDKEKLANIEKQRQTIKTIQKEIKDNPDIVPVEEVKDTYTDVDWN